MKKVFALLFIICFVFSSLRLPAYAAEFSEELDCRSAILIEASSAVRKERRSAVSSRLGHEDNDAASRM